MAIFQAACQCQCCESCTVGQKNIEKAIRALENLHWPNENNPNSNVPVVRYVLERKCARAEFLDKAGVVQFLREMLPAGLRLEEKCRRHRNGGESGHKTVDFARVRAWSIRASHLVASSESQYHPYFLGD